MKNEKKNEKETNNLNILETKEHQILQKLAADAAGADDKELGGLDAREGGGRAEKGEGSGIAAFPIFPHL